MAYIPTVNSPTSPPSPRARELASQIERAINDFQRSYPDTKPSDIRAAIDMTRGGSTEVATGSRRLAAVAVAAGLAALIGILVARGGAEGLPEDLSGDALMWIVGGLLVFIGLIRATRR
jgi:ElaB/YqjD/DUF883 family membrane-anchored ribosome-binding protein